MASSSSASSVISYESETTREPTPEYNPIAAYEVRAPLHWDAVEWDFYYQSEDDESLTDGEYLALPLGAELEEEEDDALWGEDLSLSEEESDSLSSEEDPMADSFLFAGHRMTLPIAAEEPTMMTASPVAVTGTMLTMMAATVAAAAAPASLHRPSAAKPLMCTGGRL
jgi:hypothetical protein